MAGSVRFRLAAQRRSRSLRSALILLAVGFALFGASLAARRGGTEPGLLFLGALGAAGVVLGARRLFLGARPVVVSDRHVWIRSRPIPLAQVQAVEAEGESLVLVRADGARLTEEVQGASLVAVEVARRAGMPPPRKGDAPEGDRVRYERRS